MGNTERVARYRKSREAAGQRYISLWVPADRVDEFRALAERWCNEPRLVPAEPVHVETNVVAPPPPKLKTATTEYVADFLTQQFAEYQRQGGSGRQSRKAAVEQIRKQLRSQGYDLSVVDLAVRKLGWPLK